jgi:hypothetical protein
MTVLCLLSFLAVCLGRTLGVHAEDAQQQIAQWTILIYLDGDNNLEREAVEDFLEMASVGSNGDVQIVVQFDRAPGYDRRYGDWHGTLRFHVTQGMTPEPANALADLGEANMGDGQTLHSFVQWGKATFPAQRTSLVLWNHGDGWRANALTQDTRKAVCWDETELDALDLAELGNALAQATQGGAQPLDVLAFDACLMAMIEVDTQMQPYVRVRVASEETEPSTGYPYQTILSDLQANPGWGATELARAIVTRYNATYHGETQSAIDLGASHGGLVSAVDGLARALLANRAEYPAVGDARLKAQTFQGEFVDLYDLAERIGANTSTPEIQLAAQAVQDAHQGTVIHELHGPYWPGAHGTSVYFPTSEGEWDNQYEGNRNYLDFTARTQWDEFLLSWLKRDSQPLLTLTGEVALQGRTTFEGTEIAVQPFASPIAVQPFASPIPATTVTAADGTFELSATQPCTVTARHAGFLGTQWVIDQPSASRWTLPKVTLLGGDVNGDGRINILDIAYIGARFEGQDALADLNQDGIVNILDLVLAASNFGQSFEP